MRVLAVCQYYWPEPFSIDDVCEELVRRGHSVTVLTGLPNYPEGSIPNEYKHGRNREQRRNGVRIVRTPIVARGANLRKGGAVSRVANYLSYAISGSLKALEISNEYDVVVVFQFSPVFMALPGIRYAKRARVPLLLYCFDLWPEDMLAGGMRRNGIPFRVVKMASKAIYSKADTIAVTSPGFETYFREYLELADRRFCLLPQYAEERFEQMDPGNHLKDDGTCDFVFAGNIGENQAVDVIVRAAALLKNDPVIRIHVVGSGSRYEECKSLATELGATNVAFYGRQPIEKMPSFYRMADAMILTLSRPANDSVVTSYTIPRKIQSYLAVGKPLIVSAPGASRRIVRDAACGICCAAEDPEGLALSMKSFVSLDQKERDEMGIRSRTLYHNVFSKEKFFRRFEEELESLTRIAHDNRA
ncbi:glycosyltransferase family 4 protein [Eggerthella timonensis]|uniref:glycosyltransferase family 4 protein n=1 Tax=Eggerthella timonensis TaxID=1871008 RepID=UPI000C78BBEE|nr:glycosyltransferase family 4 protein [Eggerthella timonensis]